MSTGHGSVQRHILTTLAQVEDSSWRSVKQLAEGVPGASMASRRESVRRSLHKLAREGLVSTEMVGGTLEENPELGARLA